MDFQFAQPTVYGFKHCSDPLLKSALGPRFEGPPGESLIYPPSDSGLLKILSPWCRLQGWYWLAATMGTHLIPTASHKGEVGGGGGRSTQPQKPVCAPNAAACNGHTCSLQQHQQVCRQRQESAHLCPLLAGLLNKPCSQESEHAAQIKAPEQLVQKHLRQKGKLDNQEMCLRMRARQEVAGRSADGDTVHCDNKGKGGTQPFI